MSTIEERPRAATAIPHDYSKRLMVFGGGKLSGAMTAKALASSISTSVR